MRLSKEKREALYAAIREPVLDARIELSRHHSLNEAQDKTVARIEIDVWDKVCKALNIVKNQ